MMVHPSELFADAVKRRYAVGAFNTSNLEVTLAILRAAVHLRSPVIIQTSTGALSYAGWKTLPALIRSAVEEFTGRIPVVLHLDHCSEEAMVDAALAQGYQSVMFDASSTSLDANIAATAVVVRRAAKFKAGVQGEVGRIAGSEDWVKVKKQEAFLTRVEDAVRFVEQTGVQSLAVAVGTMHGMVKVESVKPKIHLQRIAEIHAALPKIPLVLHGASHVPARTIQRAIAAGIRIVNIDTDLRLQFSKALRDFLIRHPEATDPRAIEKPAMEAVQNEVERKMRMFGSAGKN